MRYIKTVVIMVLLLLTVWVTQSPALSDSDFQTMGRRYGVSPTLLAAIAIAESQMGKILGTCEVTQAVADDDAQLRALKKIARYTRRALAEFKGSYAGAMGYMQIMPATFHEYGQDGDGDGIKDPLNPYDSLATAAYYLARKIAEGGSAQAALLNYNNSTEYCQKVLKIYAELEAESKFASAEVKPTLKE